MKSNYCGLTYPKFLQNRFSRWIWKKVFCKRNFHLFDECESDIDWYLSCDACNLMVNIHSINTEYVK